MSEEIKGPRVTLCIPHIEFMCAPFIHSLIGLWAHSWWIHQISWGQGSDSAAARNWCVEQYPPKTTDYYLFIDSDMGFPADALERLLSHDRDIVSGLCFQKHTPFRPCVYRIDTLGQIEFLYNFPENELFWVDACGGAMMLVKAEIFDKMSAHNPAWHNSWFEWIKPHSEDITFCLRAKEAGFKAWCDSHFMVDHYTMAPRGIEHFKAHQQEIRNTENIVGEHRWPDGSTFDYEKFRKEMIIPPVQEEFEAPLISSPETDEHVGIDEEPIFKHRELKNLLTLKIPTNGNHPQSAESQQEK